MSEEDKAMFLWRMRELRLEWQAEDRKEIAELRREYYSTKDETKRKCIENVLQIVHGVSP